MNFQNSNDNKNFNACNNVNIIPGNYPLSYNCSTIITDLSCNNNNITPLEQHHESQNGATNIYNIQTHTPTMNSSTNNSSINLSRQNSLKIPNEVMDEIFSLYMETNLNNGNQVIEKNINIKEEDIAFLPSPKRLKDDKAEIPYSPKLQLSPVSSVSSFQQPSPKSTKNDNSFVRVEPTRSYNLKVRTN